MRGPLLHFLLLLALGLAVPFELHAQARGCALRGRSAVGDAVTVRPWGAPAFRLELRDAELTARPDATGASSEVTLEGPLAFTARSRALSYRLVRERRVAGVLTVAPYASLSRLRARAGAVLLDAALTPDVWLRALRVPCGGVEPGEPRWGPEEPVLAIPEGDGVELLPRRRELFFWSQPGRGASVRLEVRAPESFRMVRLAVRGAWARVFWTSGGSHLEGWVSRAATREARDHGNIDWWWGRGLSGCGGRGSIEHAYRGPATVRAGAVVYAQPGRGPWARVRSSEGLEVTHTRGSPWVLLSRAPGLSEGTLCLGLEHAWVRASEVSHP